MGSVTGVAGALDYQIQNSKSVLADLQLIVSNVQTRVFKVHFPGGGADPAGFQILLRRWTDASFVAFDAISIVLSGAGTDTVTPDNRHVVSSSIADASRIPGGRAMTCTISPQAPATGPFTDYWHVRVTGLPVGGECHVEQANNNVVSDDAKTIRRIMCDPDSIQLNPSTATPLEGDTVTLNATVVNPATAASVFRLLATSVPVPTPTVHYKWDFPEVTTVIPSLAVPSASATPSFVAPAVGVATPITLKLTTIYDLAGPSLGLLAGADVGVKLVTIGSRERNLILLLDRSGSMLGTLGGGGTKWQETLNAAHVWADLAVAFRDGVNAGDEAGIMTFEANSCGWSITTVATPIVVRTPAAGTLGTIASLNRTTAEITGELGAPGTCTPIGDAMLAALGEFTAAASQKYLIVLMTDGYENSGEVYMDHDNPPSGAAHDYASQLALVDPLIKDHLTVYTIGVGTTVQDSVLNDLPMSPGAALGYYRLVNSMPELLPTFAAMLGNWLNAQLISADAVPDSTDPESATPGVYFPTNPFEHRLVIVLPWASDTDQLVVKVRKSLPAGGAWTTVAGVGAIGGLPAGSVNSFARSTHGIVSIKLKEVLDVAFVGIGNTVGTEWKVEYHPGGGAAVVITSSILVMVDLYVKGEISFDQTKYFTGDPLKLTCRLAAGSTPIRGAEVSVELARPGEGLGNFLAVNGAGYQPSIPGGADPNAPKPTMLLDLLRKKEMGQLPIEKPPTIFSDGTSRLFDDGAHGDGMAGDGVYSNTFINADKEGTYTWLVRVKGKLPDGSNYRRLFVQSKWVDVKVDPVASTVTVEPAPNPPKGMQASTITVRPQDKRGQLVGPFRPGLFKFSTTAGSFQGGVVSLPNGNYTQQVNYAPGQLPIVTVTVQGRDLAPVAAAPGCLGFLINLVRSFLAWLLKIALGS